MTPRRIHVLLEGPTEEAFIHAGLYEELRDRGLNPSWTIVQTGTTARGGPARGGVGSWPKFEGEVRKLLAERPRYAVVTMLCDFYAFPHRQIPGITPCTSADPYAKVAHVEKAMEQAIGDSRFISHLVLHEAEALVFAAAEQLSRCISRPQLAVELAKQLAEAGGNPELVNDGPETAPSKRLLKAFPGYDKQRHGPQAIKELGWAELRRQCRHLDEWIKRL